MNQSPAAVEWIDEYLDWIAPVDRLPNDRARPQHMRSNSDSVAAYLEWMDVQRGGELFESRTEDLSHPVRETALLEALKTGSDCMHIMRRALDAGKPAAETLQLACEALEHARRLVERERGAWSALRDKADSPDSPYSFDAPSWRDALERVAADVHVLAGKVMALQAHQTRQSA